MNQKIIRTGNRPMPAFNQFDTSQVRFNQVICGYYAKRDWSSLYVYLKVLERKELLPKPWKWQVGQVLLYLGRPVEALDFLFMLHIEYPDQPDIQLAIIDALQYTRFKIDTFHWIQTPVYQTIPEKILKQALEIIALHQKAISLNSLYLLVKKKSKFIFDEFDLIVHLKTDVRFHVEIRGCYFRYALVDIKNNNQRVTRLKAV